MRTLFQQIRRQIITLPSFPFSALLTLFFLAFAMPPVALSAFSLHFITYFLHFENSDFQKYDSEKYRTNQSAELFNSDDTSNNAYSSLRLKYDQRYKKTVFFVDAMRSAYWGADNFQGRDEGQNPILLNRLYFIYFPTPSFWFSFGRQHYEIGGALNDYFFYDVIDGIVFEKRLGSRLKISLLADLVSDSSQLEGAGIYSTVSKDEEQLEDFRGDTISGRGGLSFLFDLSSQINLHVFSYYLRYGASSEGGADLAENGRNHLNKVDGDYLFMSGLRISLGRYKRDNSALAEIAAGTDQTGSQTAREAAKKITRKTTAKTTRKTARKTIGNAAGQIASEGNAVGKGGRGNFDLTVVYSKGIDHQFENDHLYDDWAAALNASLLVKWASGGNNLWLSGGYFGSNFASMKARSMGGMLLWGYKSYFAAPYAYSYHFRDYAKRQDAVTFVDRTVPKTFIKLGNRLNLANFSAELRLLGLWQTEEGAYIGLETELEASYSVDNIRWSALLATFQPSDYYKNRASTNVFFSPGNDPFFGFRLSVEYILDLSYTAAAEKDKGSSDRTKQLLQQKGEFIDG